MRVLAVSSRYPPNYLGGYELACKEVMDRLRERGHEIHVLTSKGKDVGTLLLADGTWVHRDLDFAPLAQTQVEGIWARGMRERRNNAVCRECVNEIRPDVLSVWDMWGLLPSLLTTLERSGVPLTYAISSPWMLDYAATPHRWQAFWDPQQSQGARRWLKRILRNSVGRWIDHATPVFPPIPDLSQAFFASRTLRAAYVRAGWDCGEAPVIYHGVDTTRFRSRHDRTALSEGKLLISGRVVAEKGIHTAIEALRRLLLENGSAALSLDIVGPQPDAEYARALRQAIARDGLEDRVQFHGQVPHHAMPEVYGAHDVLIFPSIWEEPFALTLLEAMACGLPVVGTATGGSAEILEHELTGLIFEAGNAGSLCVQVTRLLADPGLAYTVAKRARSRIEQRFTIEHTVAQVEEFLATHIRRAAERPVAP